MLNGLILTASRVPYSIIWICMRVEITDIDINKPVVIVQLFNEAIIHFAHYILFIAHCRYRSGTLWMLNRIPDCAATPVTSQYSGSLGDHIAQDVRSGMHCMPRCACVTRKHNSQRHSSALSILIENTRLLNIVCCEQTPMRIGISTNLFDWRVIDLSITRRNVLDVSQYRTGKCDP